MPDPQTTPLNSTSNTAITSESQSSDSNPNTSIDFSPQSDRQVLKHISVPAEATPEKFVQHIEDGKPSRIETDNEELGEVFAFVISQLDSETERSLHVHLARSFKGAIAKGLLKPNSLFPSVRAISRIVGVSRETAHKCIKQLIDTGVCRIVQGVGTFVCDLSEQEVLLWQQASAELKDWGKPFSDVVTQSRFSAEDELAHGVSIVHPCISEALSTYLDMSSGSGLRALFDSHTTGRKERQLANAIANWTQQVHSGGARISTDSGLKSLRYDIAHWLNVTRGVRCTEKDVIITSSKKEALSVIANAFMRDCNEVLCEEPSSPMTRAIFKSCGASLRPVLVDASGIIVDELDSTSGNILHCNPSCQFPTGAAMPSSRRKQIAKWAQQRNALVIEEDDAGELCHESRASLPIFTHAPENVAYVYGVEMLLGRAWSLGVIVCTGEIKEAIAKAMSVLTDGPSLFIQSLSACLIESKYLEQRLKFIANRLSERRAVMLDRLLALNSEVASYTPVRSGFRQTVWLDSTINDVLVVEECRKRGAEIFAISPFFFDEPRRPGVMIDFAHTDDAKIVETIAALAEVLETYHV